MVLLFGKISGEGNKIRKNYPILSKWTFSLKVYGKVATWNTYPFIESIHPDYKRVWIDSILKVWIDSRRHWQSTLYVRKHPKRDNFLNIRNTCVIKQDFYGPLVLQIYIASLDYSLLEYRISHGIVSRDLFPYYHQSCR